MEIKKILKICKTNKKGLLFILIGGFIIGTIYYYTPKNYYTVGSLYITRKIEQGSEEYFKYEGYYSQQAAISYTENIISTLESNDMYSATLSDMNMETTSVNLRELKRNVSVKKDSPQVITLTVKGGSRFKTQEIWNTLIKNSITKLNDINKDFGDVNLSINKLEEAPVTTQSYYPLYICIGIGAGLLTLLYSSIGILKNYMKEEERY